MANNKIYTIQINGITESVDAVKSLERELTNLEERLRALESRTVNVRGGGNAGGGGSSRTSKTSALTEEEKLEKQILQLEAKQAAYKEEAYQKFGYLLDAFKFGPPPHGGMGIGLDRLIMQLLQVDSLRDVIAFPKVQNASEPMTECPSKVDNIQLEELGIDLKEEK